jgi:hypothetical protein
VARDFSKPSSTRSLLKPSVPSGLLGVKNFSVATRINAQRKFQGVFRVRHFRMFENVSQSFIAQPNIGLW